MNERDITNNRISTTVRFKDFYLWAMPDMLGLIKAGVNALGTVSPQLASPVLFKLFCTPRRMKSRNKGIFSHAEISIVKADGEKIWTYKFGNSDKRILLVHGWEGQANDFHKIITKLVDEGFEVIAFDGPAHGKSSGKQTHAIQFGEVIKDLSDKFGGFQSIIGHSFGGFASSRAIAIFPELGVENLITIGTPNALNNILGYFTGMFGLNDKVKQAYFDYVETRLGINVHETSTGNFMKDTDARVLVIHDEYDPQVSIRTLDGLLKDAPNISKTLVTYGLGHNRILRDDHVADSISEFLKGEMEYSKVL